MRPGDDGPLLAGKACPNWDRLPRPLGEGLLGKSASMPYVWLPRRAGLATLRRGDARGADPLPKHDWWNLPNSKG